MLFNKPDRSISINSFDPIKLLSTWRVTFSLSADATKENLVSLFARGNSEHDEKQSGAPQHAPPEQPDFKERYDKHAGVEGTTAQTVCALSGHALFSLHRPGQNALAACSRRCGDQFDVRWCLAGRDSLHENEAFTFRGSEWSVSTVFKTVRREQFANSIYPHHTSITTLHPVHNFFVDKQMNKK